MARQAVAADVRRFVFISSVKVNGEGTPTGCPYTADDVPALRDAYGIFKLEVEQVLLTLAASTGLEVVIIRPVLVYGSRVRANFLKMMRWPEGGLPLPLGAIDNKRNLMSEDNLVSLILICLEHPNAIDQAFLVNDGEDNADDRPDAPHSTRFGQVGPSGACIQVGFDSCCRPAGQARCGKAAVWVFAGGHFQNAPCSGMDTAFERRCRSGSGRPGFFTPEAGAPFCLKAGWLAAQFNWLFSISFRPSP